MNIKIIYCMVFNKAIHAVQSVTENLVYVGNIIGILNMTRIISIEILSYSNLMLTKMILS